MHGYEVVAEALLAERTAVLFGLLGNSNLALAGTLTQHGVRFLGARHETGAVGLAAGYAWATDGVGVCTVNHGPGLSNALTGLVSATRDRLPVVLLVADIRGDPPWIAQQADHESMVAWTGARYVHCGQADRLAATVREALWDARLHRRPVVVDLPSDLLSTTAVPQKLPAPPSEVRPRGDPDLAPVLEALRRARNPLVLAGRGAVWSGAGPALRRLAEVAGARLATTLPAKGLFAGDPYDVGVCGGYATVAARRWLAEVDCVLVFGASLNGYTTDRGTLLARATTVHCDLSPLSTVDIPVAGDARVLAQALVAAAGVARTRERWREEAPTDQTAADGLDPRVVLRAVDRWLPADRQVVADLGHFSTFPARHIGVPAGGRYLPTLGFGSIGLALATALGAAVGRPPWTLVVVGDGGLLMSLGELETLRRLGLPVVVLVLNDAAYAAEIHHLRRHVLSEELARFPASDLAGVAEALGLPAIRLREAADLDRLTANPPDGPLLVDARITTTVVADKFR